MAQLSEIIFFDPQKMQIEKIILDVFFPDYKYI